MKKEIFVLFILLFISISLSFSQEHSEEATDVKALFTNLRDFYTEDGARYTFFEDGRYLIEHYSLAEPLRGKFKFDRVTLPKRDWGINEEGTMTTIFLSFIIGKQSAIWLMSVQEGKVENGKMYLYFTDVDKGLRSEKIVLIHKKKPTKYSWSDFSDDWSEIIVRHDFTKTVDIYTRTWLAMMIEDSLEKEDQEEALAYALDKILYFPDEERKAYGALIKQILLEKNKRGY